MAGINFQLKGKGYSDKWTYLCGDKKVLFFIKKNAAFY